MDLLRKRLIHLLWIAPLILYAPVLFTGKLTYYGTVSLQFLPWRWLGWELLRGGELPLWNTYLGMGAPLAANYQSAFFYPPNWLLFLAPWIGGLTLLGWAQGLLAFAHLVLAAFGMSRLARSLGLGSLGQFVSGLSFGLSGYLVARAHFLSINAAVAWLPWVLCLVREVIVSEAGGRIRSSFWLTAVLALQLLSGHAQITFYTIVLAVVWGLYWLFAGREDNAHSHDAGGQNDVRRSFGAFPWLMIAGMLALMIAAVQLLPTAELMQVSQRAGGAEESFVMTYSFWPWRFLGLLLPGFYGQPAAGSFWGYANYWEDAVYIGLVPFVMALRAFRRSGQGSAPRSLILLLGGVTFVSFLLALGKNTPVFPFFYRYVPGFDLFQAPTRYSIWAVFSLSLLAGFGVQDWAANLSTLSRRQAGRWTAVSLALVLAGGATLVYLPFIERSFGTAILTAGLVGAAAASLGLARKRGTNWRAGLLLLIAVDLIIAGWGLNPVVRAKTLTESPKNAAVIRTQMGDGRLYTSPDDIYEMMFDHYFSFKQFSTDLSALRSSMLPGLNVLDRIQSANQFDPLLPARYERWMTTMADADEPVQDWMLSESHITMTERFLKGDPAPLRFEARDARPRAEWFACAVTVENAAEAFSGMMALAESGETGLFVEVNADAGCVPDADGSVSIFQAGSNEIRVAVSAETDGWLLLRDAYYPGWTVEIGGEALDIMPGNFMFRAVRVPAGSNEVLFVYRPLSFRIGAGVSLLGLLLMGVLWKRDRGEG